MIYRRDGKDSGRASRAATGAAAQKKNGRSGDMAFVDNRGLSPVTLPVTLSPEGSTNVHQRMAVMAVENWKDQTDPLVWNNLQYAEKKAGGPIGDMQDNRVWKKKKKGRVREIRIVEHGEKGGLGGAKFYTASDIANSMFAPDTGIPKAVSIEKITFQSCYAGVGGKDSLVSEMAGELASHGRKGVSVEGRTGVAFGFKGMGEKTAKTSTGAYTWHNPHAEKEYRSLGWENSPHGNEKGVKAYFDAMFSLQNEKTRGTKVNIFKGIGIYNDPWILAGKSAAKWKTLNPSKRGKLVAYQMAKYWKKLATLMESMGGFKPPEDAIKTG